MNKAIIIGIGGGTGSGKTTVADLFKKALGWRKVNIIQQDYYYKNRKNIKPEKRKLLNYDSPNAIDFDLLIKQLNELREYKTIKMPIYNFKNHTREKKVNEIKPKQYIILEGILIFTNDELNELMDLKIYLNIEDDIRFIRRLKRDCSVRGRKPHQVINQYLKSVKPMHNKFILPTIKKADIIIHNDIALSDVRKILFHFLKNK